MLILWLAQNLYRSDSFSKSNRNKTEHAVQSYVIGKTTIREAKQNNAIVMLKQYVLIVSIANAEQY